MRNLPRLGAAVEGCSFWYMGGLVGVRSGIRPTMYTYQEKIYVPPCLDGQREGREGKPVGGCLWGCLTLF